MTQFERNNFYVLTGGPGAGKTAVLEALRRRGLQCVDEIGRQIIREQNAIGGNIHHNGDRIAYRDLMLSRAIADFTRVTVRDAPVFFDRGIPELAGYSRLIGAPVTAPLQEAIGRYRTNAAVFVFPPWREIYATDTERKQDFAEAIETCRLCASSYDAAGYTTIEVPRVAVEDRADFIADHIGLRTDGWRPDAG